MAFDGLFTRAMTRELSDLLTDGRISKIHQPYKNEIVMIVRARGKNHKLLLSAHPSYARIQISNDSFDNPNEPPMFCMLLRKHLEGSIIQEIRQADMDRLIIIDVRGRNELGDVSYIQLMIEVMGRHSNIILVDKEKEMIIDSIKHVPSAVNSYRTILPGAAYIPPPAQEKSNPLEANEEDVLRAIDFNAGKIDRQIVQHFSGVSPLLSREILHRTGLTNRATLPGAITELMGQLKSHEYAPGITSADGKEFFYILPLTHLKGDYRPFPTLSEMLDRFYFGKAQRDRVRQQAHDLERLMKNEKEKNETKITRLESTLEEAKKADHHQLLGELLTANMHLAKRGMDKIDVVNYYDEAGATITIPLDPEKAQL